MKKNSICYLLIIAGLFGCNPKSFSPCNTDSGIVIDSQQLKYLKNTLNVSFLNLNNESNYFDKFISLGYESDYINRFNQIILLNNDTRCIDDVYIVYTFENHDIVSECYILVFTKYRDSVNVIKYDFVENRFIYVNRFFSKKYIRKKIKSLSTISKKCTISMNTSIICIQKIKSGKTTEIIVNSDVNSADIYQIEVMFDKNLW